MRNSLVVLLEVLFENRQATFLVFLTHMHASVSRAYSSASGVTWALGVVHFSFGGIFGGHTWQFDRS